jgi:hypothetical protein
MRQFTPLALVVMIFAAVMHQTSAIAASAGAVKVSITYQGKGTVDAQHRIWVWLFDTPDIGPGSMPIAEVSVAANGGTASFDGIDAKQVWIAVAFDESGTMSGNAPPPSGSPIGVLVSADGTPRSVVPGEDAAVMTFDDSQRMP